MHAVEEHVLVDIPLTLYHSGHCLPMGIWIKGDQLLSWMFHNSDLPVVRLAMFSGDLYQTPCLEHTSLFGVVRARFLLVWDICDSL